MNKTSTAFAAAFLAWHAAATAAQVDLAQNSVTAGRSTLRNGATVAPGTTISTGSKSRTQLSLGSGGSIVRAGSKTQAVLENDANLSLRQGVMLASSGRSGLGRDAVNVKTPETNVSVKGTMLVAYQPEVFLKVTCIEGSVTVRLKALVGEFVTLTAGQMVIINPAEKRLPQEVEVDLKELSATSALLGSGFPSLAAAPRLERAAGQQAKALGGGDAVRTPLVLNGAGLDVTVSNENGVNGRFDPQTPVTPPKPPRPGRKVRALGPEYVINGNTVYTQPVSESLGSSPTLSTPGFPTKTGQRLNAGDSNFTVWQFPDNSRLRNPELFVNGTVDIPRTAPDGDAYVSQGAITVGGGAPTTVTNSGPLRLYGDRAVDVKSGSSITYKDGTFAELTLGSNGRVTVTDSQINQSGRVQIAAPDVRINGAAIKSGGGIDIRSSAKAGEGGILIANSTQLQALANSVGVSITSAGGPIAVDAASISGSEILLQSGDPSNDGLIALRNVTMNGDVIRARAFGSGDRDALVINGGQFNAGSLIKFYAEGASRLRFVGDVNVNLSDISSGTAVFAGKTVQVDAGGRVRVNGNTQVYRDIDNYNKAGFGSIQTSGSHSDAPYSSRPDF